MASATEIRGKEKDANAAQLHLDGSVVFGGLKGVLVEI